MTTTPTPPAAAGLTTEPHSDVRTSDADVRHSVTLARGAFFNTLALIVAGLRAVFTLLVARLLGSAVLGMFGVAWATTDLVSKVSTFGLDTSVMTFVARTEAAGDRAGSVRIMRVALLVGGTLSVVAAMIGVVVCLWTARNAGAQAELARATGIALLALPAIALYRVSNAVSRGVGVMHHDIYSRAITDSLVTSAALLVAVAAGARALAPEIAALAGVSASGLVAYGCAQWLMAVDRGSGAGSSNTPTLLRASAAICAYDVMNIGLMQVDVIMLGLFVGRAPGVTLVSVGIYAAAAEAAATLRKINQAFGPIFTTVVARHMVSREIQRAEASFGLVARWMLAILLPALVVFACASQLIMSIFGAEFRRGSAWLAVLALACALNAFVGLGETILTVERPQLNLKNAILVSAATILLNLALIPAFGPLGAAIGMVVPYAAYGALRVAQIRTLLRWKWPWRALAKPVAAAVLALPVALVIRIAGPTSGIEFAAAAGYLLAYALAWRWIGLEPADREMLNYVVTRRRSRRALE